MVYLIEMQEGTKAVINCCHNIKNGNIELNHTQRRKLRKYSNQIKLMTDPKKGLKFKRNVINQNKDFLEH